MFVLASVTFLVAAGGIHSFCSFCGRKNPAASLSFLRSSQEFHLGMWKWNIIHIPWLRKYIMPHRVWEEISREPGARSGSTTRNLAWSIKPVRQQTAKIISGRNHL
jgi:hypothetical protein